MGLAAKVILLTFRTKINLHLPRDEFVLKKRVFDERSAHSKAVLEDSLIIVDSTSLEQRLAKKSHESHNSRITLFTAIISLPMTQS